MVTGKINISGPYGGQTVITTKLNICLIGGEIYFPGGARAGQTPVFDWFRRWIII